ncbi:MAG TPA: peptidylprolyl isomerase [Caulobacteraceae bacterium]
MFQTSRRALLAGAGALAASAAAAQTPAQAPAPPPAATPTPLPRVTLETAQGAIVLELAADKAPITAANFLRYVDAHRFDGASFYRAMKLLPQPLTGLVQGGAKNDPAKTFPPIAHESTQQTGLTNKEGAVSMARYAPGTAASEFFICVGDLSSLDADPKQSGDNLGFAVFAHVVSGMDVVKKILLAPVSATKGEDSGMKSQMLDPEVTIVSARRA